MFTSHAEVWLRQQVFQMPLRPAAYHPEQREFGNGSNMVADKFNELALRYLTFTFVQSVEDDQKGFWNSRRMLSHDELKWFDDEFSELNPPIFLEDG